MYKPDSYTTCLLCKGNNIIKRKKFIYKKILCIIEIHRIYILLNALSYIPSSLGSASIELFDALPSPNLIPTEISWDPLL